MANVLASAHIEAERRLRLVVVTVVERIWRALSGYDEENVDDWLAGVVPVIRAGQLQSVALTEAYLARALERQPLGVGNLDFRNGTSLEDVYRRPFVSLWSDLKEGKAFIDANNAALARARGSAAMDVQLAARETFGAVQDADEGIFGYTRRADGDACEFCRLVDGAYVKDGAAFPLHNWCGCSLEPQTEPHRLAVLLPDGTRIRETRGGPLIDTPTPAGVAIHEHGELGPMLTSADHEFTSQSDF